MLCPICFQMRTRKRKATTSTVVEFSNEPQPRSSGISTAKTGSKRQTTGQKEYKLDICVQRTWMPPPSALSKIAPWLRYWLLSEYYRSIKADLFNIEEKNERLCRSTRLAFSLQSNLGEYETNVFIITYSQHT